MLRVSLPDELENRLECLAERMGSTKTDCARDAIQGFVADQESYLALIETLNNERREWLSFDELKALLPPES